MHRQIDVDTMANIEPNNLQHPELADRLMPLNAFIPLFLSYIITEKLYTGHEFSHVAWLLMLLLVASVHRAGKIVNASYDFGGDEMDGHDNNDGPPAHRTDYKVKCSSALLHFFAFISLFWLVKMSPAKMGHLALYLLVLSTSFVHTCGFGPKYMGLGDMIFLVCAPVSYLFGCLSQQNEPDFIIFFIPFLLKIEAIIENHYANTLENDQEAGIRLAKRIINQTAVYSIFYIFSIPFSNRTLSLLLIKILFAIKIEKELMPSVDIESVIRQPSKLNFIFGTLFTSVLIVVIQLNELNKY